MNLRPYQVQSVASIREAYRQRHRSVLFVLPTGGGKTVVFSHIAEQAAAKGSRICILVHRQELHRQASNSLQTLGVRHGLISPRHGMDLSAHVQVASVQTLARRLHRLPSDLFHLLVIDEAHHSNAGTWAKVLEHFHAARVLGVTATPCRGDGRGLGEWYQAMVQGPTAAWLTDNGYLAPAKVLAPPGFKVQGLRKRMGDFDMEQAGQILQAGQAMGDCLAHYRQHLDGQTAIAFCCSVAHAEAVADLFQRHGVPAASIDGTMNSGTRERLLADLGAGRLKVLTSCALIGEGVDVPSVAGCILLRPTQSVSLHLQMIGRCLRPQQGKTAVVLDHVGNYLRLGHHLEEREWTLDGVTRRGKDAAPSVKVCPECFAAMASAACVCPECGHEFVAERRELEHVDGELVELAGHAVQFQPGDIVRHKDKGTLWVLERRAQVWGSPPNPYYWDVQKVDSHIRSNIDEKNLLFVFRPDPRHEQSQARTLEDLIEVGRRRGMKNPAGWARHVHRARQAKRREVVA